MLKQPVQILASVSLIALLLLQMQGRWLIFKLQQTAIRHEVKQQIKAGVPEEDLVTLKIAKVWEQEPTDRFEREHSREFRFDGEMYDIIRSKDLGDTTVYICIHDVKESGLFAKLEEMIEEEIRHPLQEGKRKQMEELVSAKYVHKPWGMKPALSAQTELERDIPNRYSDVLIDVSSPPPKV